MQREMRVQLAAQLAARRFQRLQKMTKEGSCGGHNPSKDCMSACSRMIAAPAAEGKKSESKKGAVGQKASCSVLLGNL